MWQIRKTAFSSRNIMEFQTREAMYVQLNIETRCCGKAIRIKHFCVCVRAGARARAGARVSVAGWLVGCGLTGAKLCFNACVITSQAHNAHAPHCYFGLSGLTTFVDIIS
jgi:hypothetical protein